MKTNHNLIKNSTEKEKKEREKFALLIKEKMFEYSNEGYNNAIFAYPEYFTSFQEQSDRENSLKEILENDPDFKGVKIISYGSKHGTVEILWEDKKENVEPEIKEAPKKKRKCCVIS